MDYLRKYRFGIIITISVILLLLISYYMIWVHVPYTNYKNNIGNIRDQIIETNDYEYDDYYNVYNSNQTYYILKVKENDTSKYVIYNEKNELVLSYDKEVVKQKVCLDDFKERYKVDYTDIELGYENSLLVYGVKYVGEDLAIYAFYDVETGEFIKGYRL